MLQSEVIKSLQDIHKEKAKPHVNRKKKALHKDSRRSRNHKKIWTNTEEFVKLDINLAIEQKE